MRILRHSHRSRGFTLVELMAVVVMVGVLAVLAVYGVRKYVLTAKSSEVYSMINAIRGGEEAYKDETFRYLDISGTSFSPLYPNPTPNSKKFSWTNPTHSLYSKWQVLGVNADTAVQFGYGVCAGVGQTPVPPSQPLTERTFNWPATNAPWYIVVAVGDRNENGIKAVAVSSSFSSDVFVEKEDE
jgi:type IV pilus assembly protein PilA